MSNVKTWQDMLNIRVSDYAMINWKIITKAIVKKEWCSCCWYDTWIFCEQTEQCSFVSPYDIMFHPKSNFFNKIAMYIKIKNTNWPIKVIYTNKLAKKLKFWCLEAPFYIPYLIEKINNPSMIDIFE